MFILSLQELLIPASSLYLDPNNPRLLANVGTKELGDITESLSAKSQELLRRQLIQREGAAHLIESICRLGLVGVDSIVVRPIEEEKYIVVEGNRRIAAVKTILNDIHRREIGLPEHITQTLSPIRVKVLDADASATEEMLLQGIRHISGARSWGPYQQGYLIHSLVEKNFTVTEAAKTVGLSPSRASVILKGFYGLKQMMEHPIYKQYSNPTLFSHFEHAYTKQAVREWLGWNEKEKKFLNDDSFDYFCGRITTMDEEKIVTAKSVRDYLSQILQHSQARRAFMSGASVALACKICSPNEERIEKIFQTIALFLRDTPDLDAIQLMPQHITLLNKLCKMTENSSEVDSGSEA